MLLIYGLRDSQIHDIIELAMNVQRPHKSRPVSLLKYLSTGMISETHPPTADRFCKQMCLGSRFSITW